MSRIRKYLVAATTFSIAMAIGFVMQNGDALAFRMVAEDKPTRTVTPPMQYPRQASVTSVMPALPGIANDTSPAAARPEMKGQPELPDPVTELAAVQLNAPDDEDGGAAAPASGPALTGRECAPELNAELAEAATVSLEFEAPCAANSVTTIHHQGMIFTVVTDEAGRAEFAAPALARNAVFIAELPNGAGAAAIVTVPDLDDFDRAVLQWQGDTGLQIHALEFGADYDDEGHVWSASARGTDAALAGNGGFLMKLGAEGIDNAFHAEVYTFPTGTVSQTGQVDLSVEAEVLPTTCGREISAQTIQVSSGLPADSLDLTMTLPACGSVGEFLVLKNMLESLTIAGR